MEEVEEIDLAIANYRRRTDGSARMPWALFIDMLINEIERLRAEVRYEQDETMEQVKIIVRLGAQLDAAETELTQLKQLGQPA
jgi:hypothetical protein